MPRSVLKILGRPLSLDARPDRLDIRDRAYIPPLRSLPSRWPSDEAAARWLPAYADAGLIRDQGEDGACTGFGLAAVIDYLQFVRTYDVTGAAKAKKVKVRKASPAMLYELARLYDEWRGEDYEGSSCRGALKGWHRHGICSEELWPYKVDPKTNKRVFVRPNEDDKHRDDADRNWDVDAMRCTLGVYYRIDARSVVDMQAAILETGAIYVAADVHEGWDVPTKKALNGHDSLPRIDYVPSPKDPGGHAFALVGYNEDGFVVQNSWSMTWGARGFAVLPYADWVAHGADAWAVTLGVPCAQGRVAPRASKSKSKAKAASEVVRSPRYIVPGATTTTSGAPQRARGLIAATDSFEQKYRKSETPPLDNTGAYRHAIVLDRGFPVRCDMTVKDGEESIERVGYECPKQWLESKAGRKKILIFAHGGLNSEADSIKRIRAIAPYALDNDIYPLFITWRTGALETVSDLVEEELAKAGFGELGARALGWADKITDKTDRLLEPLLRVPGGALWSQMKLNAERASDNAMGGCNLLVTQLARLAAFRPGLEIHLIGHSAGSIVLGRMLEMMQLNQLKAASLRLLAPACTLEFALRRFKAAVDSQTLAPKTWHIHTLSDRNEQDDCVGPYCKSLLYLVSRSFEDSHKTPLLGMQDAFDRATVNPKKAEDDTWGTADEGANAKARRAAVKGWIDFWDALNIDKTNRHTLEATHVSTGHKSIRASHGCFDNAVDIIGDALGYIADPKKPVRVEIESLDY